MDALQTNVSSNYVANTQAAEENGGISSAFAAVNNNLAVTAAVSVLKRHHQIRCYKKQKEALKEMKRNVTITKKMMEELLKIDKILMETMDAMSQGGAKSGTESDSADRDAREREILHTMYT